ncbi:DUF6325 family protein [Leifsonia aquatica]|uniref:DUF6325 family protein n=1 Tax=Leifsonia aquatica TaxID=144185 RepID=UPI0004696036|nr:DUF6325 family protein [Leifsonia aquatica]
MADFEYGPAEFIVAQFDTDLPSPAVVEAILDLVASGTVRLLDLLIVRRGLDGSVELLELEEIGDQIGMADVQLEASGLAGDEDVAAIADLIEPGRAGAVLVIEHRWATELASRFFAAGGSVVHTERIPAPVVNAIVAGDYDDETPAGAEG